MTGFARRERQGPWGTLTCELRTVNHRYLELSLRLPDDLRGLESDARQLVGRTCVAARSMRACTCASLGGHAAALELNTALVEQLLSVRPRWSGSRRPAGPSIRSRCCAGPASSGKTERDISPLAGEAIELLRETVDRPQRRARARGRPNPRDAGARVARRRARSSHTCARGCRRSVRAIRARVAERVGATRHAGGSGAPRAGDRAARVQDGRRGGTRPRGQPPDRDAAACSTRRSPPAGASIS